MGVFEFAFLSSLPWDLLGQSYAGVKRPAIFLHLPGAHRHGTKARAKQIDKEALARGVATREKITHGPVCALPKRRQERHGPAGTSGVSGVRCDSRHGPWGRSYEYE
jgi:hypothetical protein